MSESLRKVFPEACLNCPALSENTIKQVREDLAVSRALTATANDAEQTTHSDEAVSTTREIAEIYMQRAADNLPRCEPGVWTARSEHVPQRAIAECGKIAGVIILHISSDYPDEHIQRPEML
jgi:hypothetical protein